jgi:hypothetical protein
MRVFIFCASGGIRTPNNGSEDRRDIHFTTDASEESIAYCLTFARIYTRLNRN